MSRPSFQFYPGDWRNNAKLRRCSEAARGAWVDILCVLHDADEYGVVRWPLADLARAAGVKIKSANELATKGVLKGDDVDFRPYVWRPFHGGKYGDPIILVANLDAPTWYSSRLVRDEYMRHNKGAKTRFSAENQPPSRRYGDGTGDGSSSPPSSLEVSSLLNDFVVGKNAGVKNGHTIQDPGERLNRFQKSLAEAMGRDGYMVVKQASDPTDPLYRRSLEACKAIAEKLGKGWPHQWPK